MSAAFTVEVCSRCGYAAYPPRILCPECSGAEWRRGLADSGVVEEITDITPAADSGGKEYVKLHLKEAKRGAERTRFACKTKMFEAKA